MVGTSIRMQDNMSNVLLKITNTMDNMLSSWLALDASVSGGFDMANIDASRNAFRQCRESIEDMVNEQIRLNDTVKETAATCSGLERSVKSVLGVYAGIEGVKKLVGLSDEYTNTMSRLSLIAGTDNASAMYGEIFDAAQRARAPVGDMADMVAKLSLNAKGAFRSNAETIQFAENLNKIFAISGTDASGIASATLQMTQALGSGVLRGEEFNSVFEQAPMVMELIAEKMGINTGQLKEMASEGQITADIVTSALLGATDEINAQFDSMSVTWGQLFNTIGNDLLKASQPMLRMINGIANGISQNIDIIKPIFGTLLTIVGLYTTALLANKAASVGAIVADFARGVIAYRSAKATLAAATAAGVNVSALGAEGTATALAAAGLTAHQVANAQATVAQAGFNTALLACPLTWVVLAIVVVIGLIYGIVAAINKAQGATISATGVIFGAVTWLFALIGNLAIGTIEGLIQLMWTMFVEPFIGIVEFVLNVFNGGFDSFGDAVKSLLGNIISWFLSLGMVVTKIIDAIFGTNWTDGLSNLQDDVLSWGKNENAITLNGAVPTFFDGVRIDMGNAYNAGYDFGAGFEDKFSNPFDQFALEIPALEGIEKNTAGIADSLEVSQEDLKYLRDIAERDTVNRFTTAEVKVEMGGVTNQVNKDIDLDGIVSYLAEGVQEALFMAAEGVHI